MYQAREIAAEEMPEAFPTDAISRVSDNLLRHSRNKLSGTRDFGADTRGQAGGRHLI